MKDNTEDYTKYLENIKGLSPKTVKLYNDYHKNFKHINLDQKEINRFIAKNKNNSVVRGYMKSYLEFLEEDYDLPPARTGTIARRIIRPIPRSQIERLRNFAYNKLTRDGIIIDLLYFGAMRINEISSIKVNSFNWQEWFKDPEQFCEVQITGKGKKTRRVLISPRAIKSLLEVYFERSIITSGMQPHHIIDKLNGLEDPLFKIKTWKVWHIVKKCSEDGLNWKIRPHELRHARATELESNGATTRDIQMYLGHNSLNTTEIYLHTSESKSLSRIKEISHEI